jgi:prepilin-type processing-associated H-X9-DG protein
MSNYPHYGEPVTPRRGTSPLTIFFIIIGSCLVGGLVVVGALAALLFPVFDGAKTAAKRASCASNLKQLSLGLMMYVQDYDDKMPPAGVWATVIVPYTKNSQLYVCPTRPDVASAYAFNQKLSGRVMAKVASPAASPMLFESSLGSKNAFDQLQSFVTPHNGVGNVAYADGHVKAVTSAPSASAGLK